MQQVVDKLGVTMYANSSRRGMSEERDAETAVFVYNGVERVIQGPGLIKTLFLG